MLPAQVEGELDVRVPRIWTARKHVLHPLGPRPVDVPLTVQTEVVRLDLVRGVRYVHPGTVVSPCADQDRAGLVVEREVPNINVTGRCENTAWFPVHVTVMTQENAHLAEVWCQVDCPA